jgi:hypothetical protein
MTPTAVKRKLHHRYQVGVEISGGGGYRVIKPYGDVWCGGRTGDLDNENKSFCTSASQPFLEAGLSFGLAKILDLVVDFKYGLVKDKVSDRNPLTLLAGVRLWIDPDAKFKIGVGLQLMMDFTKQDSDDQRLYNPPKEDSFDVGGRIYGQFQYDFMRYLGVFIKIAGTVGALRWVRVEPEGSGGLQARFP